jgi:glycosyltransferase involved in cell wall biosynthesis
MSETPIDVSVIIPIYNEEGILSASVADLTEKLGSLKDQGRWPYTYELILTENGSTDATVEIAQELQTRHPELKLIHSSEPDYGLALRRGILQAKGRVVICDEIDLCDTDFYERALEKIEGQGYDLVVGSKALDSSYDKRPAFRKFATFVLNSMFRVFLGFRGTDTHGLKAFNRERMLEVVDRCLVNKDLFASEFVIRAERMKFRMIEIPVEVIEKRPPSINLVRRVPNVLKNIGRLTWTIRVVDRKK